jgi:hypothetical protein
VIAIGQIEAELKERLAWFEERGKLLEAQRLRMRTAYDLEMLREVGVCSGIENYSRYLDGRSPGEMPYTLLDYFPDDFLVVLDESHQLVPQLHGQYEGDRSRKDTLVEHGFRLPSAMDNRPLRFEEFLDKVNQVTPTERTEGEARLAEYVKQAKEGTISPADGVVAEKLAERLGKPKVAAEICALAPPAPESTPMSSLPDVPLPPITGALDLVRESLRALTLSTRDPLANSRGGVRARDSRAQVPVVSGMGWSPFTFFRSLLKKNPIEMIMSPASAITSAAAMAVAASAKKAVGKGQSPAEAAPAPAPAAPAPEPAREEKVAGTETPLPAEALKTARRSAEDVLPPDPKTAKKGSPVSSLGADKSFKDYVKDAVKSKKMSRADFNKAIEVHLGKGTTPEKKTASGEKVLAFLAKKGVKVET